MKKISKLVLTILFAFSSFIPIVSAKEQFISQIEENINLTEEILGSSTLIGNNVKVDKNISGILFAGANSFKFNSTTDYLVSVGNIISINGTINNDAFILGNEINFIKDTVINRDLVIYGNNITISGTIGRDLIINGQNIIIDNANINGNVTLNTSSFEVTENSNILGTLKYNKNAKTKIDNKAQINNIIKTKSTEEVGPTITNIIIERVLSFIRMLVVLLAMVLIIPRLFKKIKKQHIKSQIKDSLLTFVEGLLALILIPLTILILLISSLGISLGLLLLVIYIISIYISFILSGYYIGMFIFKKLLKKDTNDFFIGSIGILIIYLLKFIPFISFIATIIEISLGFGIMLKLFTNKKIGLEN